MDNKRKASPPPHRPGSGRPQQGRPQSGRPQQGGRPVPSKPAVTGVYGNAPTPISPARLVALDSLLDVERGGAYASLALDQRIVSGKLSDVDRRLAVEITYGTLEKRLYIDWLLAQYMERMPDESTLREVLRLSVYQMLFLDRVPDDAICSQAADILRARNLQGFGPLCFAVLKRISREKATLPAIPQDDEMENLSLTYSVPAWIIQKLIEQRGREQALAFLSFRPRRGVTTTFFNPMRVYDKDAVLAEIGIGGNLATPGVVPGAYLARGDAAQSDAFRKGLIGVQGETSQLCALLTGASRGQRVLDACAAPGGKACHMAVMMGGTGRVTAWDIHPHRVELIAAAARRLGLESVRPSVWDATRVKEDMVQTMDVVLVDAPCSGLGMMPEKPDLRYRMTPEDVEKLSETQTAILAASAAYVKRGGVLVYATCTLFSEENEGIVSAFLKNNPDFTPEFPQEMIPEAWRHRFAEPEKGALLWPQETGAEGFYIMRMRRAR